ncbi:MAG: FG-GAP repeat domain-containing protein [Thermoanaerobaculia bacterium]
MKRIFPLLLLLAAAALAQPANVRTARAGPYESATVSLPGFLVQAAGVTGPGGHPGVALLLSNQKDLKGPKTLWLFDSERRALERLAAGLHEEVNAVAGFDLDGHGPGPIAGMPGVIFAPSGGRARQVLESRAIDLRSVTGSGPGRPWIPVAHTGVLELFAPAPGGTLARKATFPLPVKAERQRWGVRLSSPPVSLLPGDPPVFAAGPEAEGHRRLKTVLQPADGAAPSEAWSLLPAGERLVGDYAYLRLDGAPVLAAASFEKIGVFAKKRFRLFLLNRDRSRKGSPPTFSTETDCPLWFPLDATTADVDGDGRQDLILSHPAGLRGKELIVSAWQGLGNGKFDPNPRRWKLNEQVTDWRYGADLTGDGLPDLLVYVGDRLLLYPGEAKGRPVAGKALWSFPVSGAPKREQRNEEEGEGPERERSLEVLELPGGGRIAFARGAQKDGRTVLTFVERR